MRLLAPTRQPGIRAGKMPALRERPSLTEDLGDASLGVPTRQPGIRAGKMPALRECPPLKGD